MRKQKADTVKIVEDVRIPGTDIILEVGDKIEVMEERTVSKPVSSASIMGSKGTYSGELTAEVGDFDRYIGGRDITVRDDDGKTLFYFTLNSESI